MPRRRSGKKIDFVHWTGFSAGTTAALSAGTLGATVFAAQHDPETLMRIRGEYVTFMDAAGASGRSVLVSAGMILVPEGTGTTVLWSPFTDADAPWIWYDSALISYEEMVVDVVDIPSQSGVRRVIDSKSMRIIRNQEVQMVIENTTIGSAASVRARAGGRVLFGT